VFIDGIYVCFKIKENKQT